MIKGLYILGAGNLERIYDSETREQIENIVDIYAPPLTPADIKNNPSILRNAEVIFSGWGMSEMDNTFLENAPKLKIIFYGSGSVKNFVTEKSWEKGIRVSSAYAANAVPVSEFTFAEIILSLKRTWLHASKLKEDKVMKHDYVPGCYKSTVGIVSLGMIGTMVCERLKSIDVNVIAYDPFASAEVENNLNIKLCSLEEVFEKSDVVSLHTPWLKETENMIGERHFRMMKNCATFINTARGAVVNEEEMIKVLKDRPDIYALLDVTYPEPPIKSSPLYTMPNVILTPHIAGSMQAECRRMGSYMLEELKLYVEDKPLKWELNKEKVAKMA